MTHDSRVWNIGRDGTQTIAHGHVKNEKVVTLQDREFITASLTVNMAGDGMLHHLIFTGKSGFSIK